PCPNRSDRQTLFFFGDCGVSSVNDGCLRLHRETATVGGGVFPSRNIGCLVVSKPTNYNIKISGR
ncbi:unnamed protein product, partial [Musa hybrid cultivar]